MLARVWSKCTFHTQWECKWVQIFGKYVWYYMLNLNTCIFYDLVTSSCSYIQRSSYRWASKEAYNGFHSRVNYNDKKLRKKNTKTFISSGKDKTLWHFWVDMTYSCELMNSNCTQQHQWISLTSCWLKAAIYTKLKTQNDKGAQMQ